MRTIDDPLNELRLVAKDLTLQYKKNEEFLKGFVGEILIIKWRKHLPITIGFQNREIRFLRNGKDEAMLNKHCPQWPYDLLNMVHNKLREAKLGKSGV